MFFCRGKYSNNMIKIIEYTLKTMNLSYNNSKITLDDYDEMIHDIENIKFILSIIDKPHYTS